MGNDFLKGFKRSPLAQRREVERRQQANVLRTVYFVEWDVFNQFVLRPAAWTRRTGCSSG